MISVAARRTAADAKGTSTLNTTIDVEAALRPLPPAPGPMVAAAGPLHQTILVVLDDAKAEDIVSIDLSGRTALADGMVIATGRSDRHVGAIANRLAQALKDGGFGTARVEGFPQCDWVLIDAGDIIVHVFRPEVRSFYNLEKLWGADRPKDRLVG